MGDTVKNKEHVLKELQEALDAGVITSTDVRSVLGMATVQEAPEEQTGQIHLSASETLYYIGGLVLFGAQIALLAQQWDSLEGFGRILLSLVLGGVVWMLAAYLIKSTARKERSHEIGNALLLTGSLGVSAGVFITLAEVLESSDTTMNMWHTTLALGIIGLLHWAMDVVLRKDVLAVVGALVTSATVYMFLASVLDELDATESPEVVGLIFIASAAYLAALASLVARQPDRKHLKLPLWSVSAFVIFGSVYALAAAGDYDVLWQIVFPFMLYGAFALSASRRIRTFLLTGGFFLFAYILLISFKYFGDGLGIAGALLVGGIGVIASAVFLANFNERHFKNK